jgi:hypothetical protein
MTTVITGIAGLRSLAGEHLGRSAYRPISQDEVDAFAELSGDHQWIHVDVVACADTADGVQMTYRFTMQAEASPKPACVAEMLVRYTA